MQCMSTVMWYNFMFSHELNFSDEVNKVIPNLEDSSGPASPSPVCTGRTKIVAHVKDMYLFHFTA